MCYMLYLDEVTTTVSGMPIILTETVRQNIIIVTLATFTLDVVGISYK